ncbi:hypothetical protein Lalb_Chr05g0226271 [Lupinus albus]|uniref:Uncharacterized protein n=1 Tax=Lupinus albus TaxID=3870 RepID=A0A6A4QL24_LUPAL|nr:hypothetical protein Lalb_Chr05g0226271 [Lupinus albus]
MCGKDFIFLFQIHISLRNTIVEMLHILDSLCKIGKGKSLWRMLSFDVIWSI